MRILLHNDILTLLLIWHLLNDELVEHLLLETEGCDGEVEQGDLDLGLGGVVGVGQRRGHEELEVLVVGDLLVTDTDRTTLVNLLLKDGLERRVKLFSDVLYKEPFASLDSLFELLHKRWIAHLDVLQAHWACVDILAQILDELVGLVLRVYHERPSSRLEDNDGVLDGQIVTG